MKKILILSLCLLIVSCRQYKEVIKEVPIETIKTEYKTEYIHDTTSTIDSTIIIIKGDTVYSEHIKTIYVGKTVRDTLITHDTIPQIINTETTITDTVKEPQWWPVYIVLGILLLYVLITKTKLIKIIKNLIKLISKLFN